MLLLATFSQAATLTVGPSGTYATIADAEAATADGDVLELEALTWYEDLRPAGRSLTYSSTGGVIAGATGDPCLDVTGGSVVVRGLTFDGCARAMRVEGATLTVDGVTVEDGSCDAGCALYADGATVDVTTSTFRGNVATSGGGAVYSAATTLSLDGVEISDNAAGESGGGIYATGDVTLTDVELSGNHAGDYGGGGYFSGAHAYGLVVSGGEIAGNTSGADGGGLYVNDYEPVEIDGAVFEDNVSSGYGGGLFVHGNYSLTTRIAGVYLVGNRAGSYGGGLWTQYGADLEVASAVVSENYAGVGAGGIGSTDSSVTLDGVLLVENDGGGPGGGLYVSGASSVEARNVTAACNTASRDGAGFHLSATTIRLDATVSANNVGGDGYWIGGSLTAYDTIAYSNGHLGWDGVGSPVGSNDNENFDPGFRGVVCDGSALGDDVAPVIGSRLVDRWASGTDVDGSVGDGGAYGGAYGDLDADRDGWGYWDGDCDEGDPAINPGETEVWYDGVDQDCDERDDDQDGDGYVYAADCDDTAADVSPAGVEVWYDGVDQDCDGNDDDQDGDGYALADDCDDTTAEVSPAVAEV
ncbi:MAG: MopE-related protein, partial [Myxococcota bacterium]